MKTKRGRVDETKKTASRQGIPPPSGKKLEGEDCEDIPSKDFDK